MRALIIGAAGFVGGHLMERLLLDGCQVAASKLPGESIARAGVSVHDLDILAPEQIDGLLCELQPDVIYHLAAQSSVAVSWKKPSLTADINIKGTINVLEAVRAQRNPPKLLLIGSGEEYGRVRPEEVPIVEETLLRPGNVYAATKAAQGMLGSIYAEAYGLHAVMIRAFNHVGPGQRPGFVIPDFCRQIVQIERGEREPVIQVGNLAAKRDFTDVRDVVRAYSLLGTHGQAGAVYNVGSGTAVAVHDILDKLLALAKVKISVEVDKARFRPVDLPEIAADNSRLTRETGWRPEIPLDVTLRDALDEWRNTKD